MKRSFFDKKFSFAITMSLVTLLVGFLIGLMFKSGIKVDNKLTVDGIMSALGVLLAVIAATFLLPLKIQPLLNKQKGIVTVAHEDIKDLLDLIVNVLEICEQLNVANRKITEADRKIVLARHKQIHNLALSIKTQSLNFPALAKFAEDIFQPLNDSHSDFADNVIPNRKLTDIMFLNVRNQLDPIIYKLRELRYKLN